MKNLFNAKNKKKIILLGIIFIVLILLLITIFIFSNKQYLLSDNLNLKCELVKTDDPNVYIADNFYVEYKSNDTYSFLGLTKSVEEVSIPNTINKIPVTSARFVSYLDLENYNKERAKRGDPRKVKKYLYRITLLSSMSINANICKRYLFLKIMIIFITI